MADRKLKMKFAAEDGDYMLAEREHREIQEMAAIAKLQASLFSDTEREKQAKEKRRRLKRKNSKRRRKEWRPHKATTRQLGLRAKAMHRHSLTAMQHHAEVSGVKQTVVQAIRMKDHLQQEVDKLRERVKKIRRVKKRDMTGWKSIQIKKEWSDILPRMNYLLATCKKHHAHEMALAIELRLKKWVKVASGVGVEFDEDKRPPLQWRMMLQAYLPNLDTNKSPLGSAHAAYVAHLPFLSLASYCDRSLQ